LNITEKDMGEIEIVKGGWRDIEGLESNSPDNEIQR
jgi:hypothetical protein